MTTETTTLMIAEYNPIEAAMSELRSRYAGVIFPVATKEGMADAKDVKKRLTKLRTSLEALRKEIKEPALRRTQDIDVEAKAIEKQIRELEGPIADQIEQEEARVEAIKAAAAAAEAARVADIQEKITGIRGLPLALAGEGSEVIESELQALAGFEPNEAVFAEFTADCAQARHEVMGALRELADKVKAQEDAAAAAMESKRIADEALAAERAAIEEERAAIARERAELAAARAAIEASKVVPPVIDTSAVPITHSNGAPMYSTTTFKDNGEPIMLDDQGKRSVFCDIADDAEPEFTIHDKADEVTEFVAPRHIRQFALATADQFDALAGKVEACGVSHFANSLRLVAASVREGAFDAALAGADFETLVKFDNDLIDSTVTAIDSLGADEVSAAA